jgi:hypothetical protein
VDVAVIVGTVKWSGSWFARFSTNHHLVFFMKNFVNLVVAWANQVTSVFVENLTSGGLCRAWCDKER